MMNENIHEIVKILKKYGKLENFKTFFKDLCYSVFPFKNIIKKEHVLKILNEEIPFELTYENEKFTNLFKIFLEYKNFNMWPVHIHDIILLLVELFKNKDDKEKVIQSLMELFEQLLIF